MQSGRNSGALAARGFNDRFAGRRARRASLRNCEKVLPMLPVDQRKPVLSQGAERLFIKKLVFPHPARLWELDAEMANDLVGQIGGIVDRGYQRHQLGRTLHWTDLGPSQQRTDCS